MNNNKSDQRALLAGCKGVFSTASFITVGGDGKPEPYVSKLGVNRDSYKGKQFVTVPAKEGRTPETFFDKKHLWMSDGAPYIDRLKYQETQSVKKKGFGTGDYSRKDEFSMTFRTEQYRQLLKMEDKFAKRSLQMLAKGEQDGTIAALQASAAFTASMSANSEPEVLLYDLVFEKENDNTCGSSKVLRDTKNRTMLSHDRNLGSYRTTTRLAHTAPAEFHKPEFAHAPIIRDTFFRRSGAFPDSAQATSD